MSIMRLKVGMDEHRRASVKYFQGKLTNQEGVFAVLQHVVPELHGLVFPGMREHHRRSTEHQVLQAAGVANAT